jgi:hypothetical protein
MREDAAEDSGYYIRGAERRCSSRCLTGIVREEMK